MQTQVPAALPEGVTSEGVFIENALARLTSAYQTVMLESHRTESDLVAEYLVAHADQVLDLHARARSLGPVEAERWLGIIRERIDRIVYMRRPK